MSRKTNKAKADDLFIRACKQEERGNLRSAFRLMLSAAKLGDTGAQVNVGNYYDDKKVVKRNRDAALYWYRRAYRRGDSSAANNIGILWRNEGKFKRALHRFTRAVKLGNDEANIEIGKHYLHNEKNPRKAIPHFKHVTESDWVSQGGVEGAAKLLKKAQKTLRIQPFSA